MFLSHYNFHHGNIENIGSEDLNAVAVDLRAFLIPRSLEGSFSIVILGLWNCQHANMYIVRFSCPIDLPTHI